MRRAPTPDGSPPQGSRQATCASEVPGSGLRNRTVGPLTLALPAIFSTESALKPSSDETNLPGARQKPTGPRAFPTPTYRPASPAHAPHSIAATCDASQGLPVMVTDGQYRGRRYPESGPDGMEILATGMAPANAVTLFAYSIVKVSKATRRR